MKNKYIGKIKLLVVIAIIVAFVWFLVVYPMILFHDNEKVVEKAARRYFELNSDKLPTGERIKTLTLEELYNDSYMEKDLYSPYTKKTCSITNSWVKVKRENNNYQYYVYLDCGVLSSTIDHKGPEIKLNGKNEITIEVGEEYKEEGVKSVVDNSDGKIKTSNVTVRGDVDTSKVGTYEIQYSAMDSLNNRTVVTRTVKVVKTLSSVIKKNLGQATNFVGNPENNYIRLSNMVFRVYGINKDGNIVIVADQDIANVNHTKIEEWLDYYYDHLNNATKKMIVPSKFCNMKLTDTTLDNSQCTSYTDKKKVYIPSAVEVNKAQAGVDNFMKTSTISWVANEKSAKEAYATRTYFLGDNLNKSFVSYDSSSNYGVRPMMVIKGSTLVSGGDGTANDPYVFGDTKKVKNADEINTRFTGEYLEMSGTVWRIIDVMDDGSVKIISEKSVDIDTYDGFGFMIEDAEKPFEYNVNKKTSLGYFINNDASRYVDTSNLINHEIEVPIYKNKIIYGEEIKTKKYKAKLSAPNMYEMFSAQSAIFTSSVNNSYWLINTSQTPGVVGLIYGHGVPLNEKIESYEKFGVRVVGYLKGNSIITSGRGTASSPYKVK